MHKIKAVMAWLRESAKVPVWLVVHHEQGGCTHCAFSEIPALMGKLTSAPRSQLRSFKGGNNQTAFGLVGSSLV